MPGFLQSLARIGSYRSLPYAVASAVMTVPMAPFALAIAVSVDTDSRIRALLALLALAVLMVSAFVHDPPYLKAQRARRT